MALRVMSLECENGKFQKRANLIIYQEGIPFNTWHCVNFTLLGLKGLINTVHVVARFMISTSELIVNFSLILILCQVF